MKDSLLTYPDIGVNVVESSFGGRVLETIDVLLQKFHHDGLGSGVMLVYWSRMDYIYLDLPSRSRGAL